MGSDLKNKAQADIVGDYLASIAEVIEGESPKASSYYVFTVCSEEDRFGYHMFQYPDSEVVSKVQGMLLETCDESTEGYSYDEEEDAVSS